MQTVTGSANILAARSSWVITPSATAVHGTGAHYTTIMTTPKVTTQYGGLVYVKVKCQFTAEIVRVSNSSSSFGDINIILNILNFPN